MSATPIPGPDPAGAVAAGDTEPATFAEAAGTDPTPATGEQTGDRLCLDVLSREPVIRFRDAPDTGAPRAVTVEAGTGRTAPLASGITSGSITRDLLSAIPDLLLAPTPIMREVAATDDRPGHTDVIDPATGEIVERVAARDAFGLDQAVRSFRRRALVDKAT